MTDTLADDSVYTDPTVATRALPSNVDDARVRAEDLGHVVHSWRAAK